MRIYKGFSTTKAKKCHFITPEFELTGILPWSMIALNFIPADSAGSSVPSPIHLIYSSGLLRPSAHAPFKVTGHR